VIDKVAVWQVFSEYFSFPCQLSFHRLPHIHHRLSSRTCTIDQLVVHVPNGLILNPPLKKSVFRPGFEPDTYRMQGRSAIDWANWLGAYKMLLGKFKVM
jgi:hypothetical protein